MMTQRFHFRALVLIALIPLMSGCVFGTLDTRIDNRGDWAGRYPLQAVVEDIDDMTSSANGHVDTRALSLISIPLDLAIDVLLLPVDMVLWPFGFHK